MNREDVIEICETIKNIIIGKMTTDVDEIFKVEVDDESLNISVQYEEPEIYGCYHCGYRKEYEIICVYFDEILERINK